MRYILNPGDGCDVEIASGPLQFGDRKGDLYRLPDVEILPIERFDRNTGNWYEIDEPAHSVPIKVLRAAGLYL